MTAHFDPPLSAGFADPAPDAPIYAMGEVAGRAGLLGPAFATIASDWRQTGRAGPPPRIAVLGDYVGPGRRAGDAIEILRAAESEMPGRLMCLMGDRDRRMLDFLDDPAEVGPDWLGGEGRGVLEGFGLAGIGPDLSRAALGRTASMLLHALPDGALRWLEARPLGVVSGTVALSHGAPDPDRPVGQQRPHDLLSGAPRGPRADGRWAVHAQGGGLERVGEVGLAPQERAIALAAIHPGTPPRLI